MPPKKLPPKSPKDPLPTTPTEGPGPWRLSYGPDGTPERVYADGHREPVDE